MELKEGTADLICFGELPLLPLSIADVEREHEYKIIPIICKGEIVVKRLSYAVPAKTHQTGVTVYKPGRITGSHYF